LLIGEKNITLEYRILGLLKDRLSSYKSTHSADFSACSRFAHHNPSYLYKITNLVHFKIITYFMYTL